MTWSLYYSFTQQKHNASSVSHVEVLPFGSRQVTRTVSKKNLHIVRENNVRRRIENTLFDKFWYESRHEKRMKIKNLRHK